MPVHDDEIRPTLGYSCSEEWCDVNECELDERECELDEHERERERHKRVGECECERCDSVGGACD